VALAQALAGGGCPGLTDLSFASPLAVAPALTALAQAVAGGACHGLQTLDLFTTAAGAGLLAEGIRSRHLPRLEHLRLLGSTIGDEGVGALAEALRLSPCSGAGHGLRTLVVVYARMGDEGCRAVARGMREPGGALWGLCELALPVNVIHDSGAVAIAEALEAGAGQQLTSLDLTQNRLGEAAKARLRAAVAAGGCPRMRHDGLKLADQRG
jgi:hypothetical protein